MELALDIKFRAAVRKRKDATVGCRRRDGQLL